MARDIITPALSRHLKWMPAYFGQCMVGMVSCPLKIIIECNIVQMWARHTRMKALPVLGGHLNFDSRPTSTDLVTHWIRSVMVDSYWSFVDIYYRFVIECISCYCPPCWFPSLSRWRTLLSGHARHSSASTVLTCIQLPKNLNKRSK